MNFVSATCNSSGMRTLMATPVRCTGFFFLFGMRGILVSSTCRSSKELDICAYTFFKKSSPLYKNCVDTQHTPPYDSNALMSCQRHAPESGEPTMPKTADQTTIAGMTDADLRWHRDGFRRCIETGKTGRGYPIAQAQIQEYREIVAA